LDAGILVMSQALVAAAKRLENWIKQEAVPLWLARGIDPATGANYERLTPAGAPDLESTVRVRVQARQAFFFAAAYDRGWCPQGKDVAISLLNFVHQQHI
jgi:mannose/cellobiose epimerase-like protein (N-acyl-D-glucosamine 2-epimerase family)